MEEQKITDKSLEKILNKEELRSLEILLTEDGWAVMKKIAKVIRTDWAEQMSRIDYRGIEKEGFKDDMIYKQGMFHGVEQFVNYLDKKREKWAEKE